MQKITTLFFFITISVIAQQDGYWDKDRTTNRQILVSARQKIAIKSEDFPTGTTEILYRITLLDQNQELSASLVSLLKSIPDPTGISQGSAGAVFLLSKIAGNDKCTYAVFSSETIAKNYQETGSISKACLVQTEPINKDAKLLSINKTLCIKSETQNIWFGFESKNWLFSQKIVLEIVPWVDNKLARGWNINNKKTVLQELKQLDLEINPINKDLWTLSILVKIQKDYTFSEYKSLETIEKTKISNDIGSQILKEISQNDPLFKAFRMDANIFFKQKNFEQAIGLLENGIVSKNQSNANDFNQLGYYYLFTKQYQKAIQNLLKGQEIDAANLAIKLNLAHAYLLSANFAQAKTIYKKYQYQNINASTTWKFKLNQDIIDFEKAGISNPDFQRILKKLDD